MRMLLCSVALLVAGPVYAAPQIACTGTLIDVDLRPRALWPLAVIYDEAGNYACTIDRGNSGHEPLKPCSMGEKCRVEGTYRKIGATCSIQIITSIDRVGPAAR